MPIGNQSTPSHATAVKPATEALNELDFDMDVFLEPFPEEQELINACTQAKLEKHKKINKENILINMQQSSSISPNALEQNANSKSTQKSSNHNTNNPTKKPVSAKQTLAAKLAAKRCNILSKTPTKAHISNVQTQPSPSTSKHLKSPHQRLQTNSAKHETSPSIFDLYVSNVCKKSKFAAKMQSENANLINSFLKEAPNSSLAIRHTQDSPIVARRKTSKRKIFESDSDESNHNNSSIDCEPLVNNLKDDESDDSDFEQEAKTKSSKVQHRNKRRRISSFIHDEAAKSGSDHSSDEAEQTIGNYMLDSVIVQSGSSEEGDISTRALYLQSLKSPANRRGAFKIPAFRQFNDQSHIYSQAVPVENSQYVTDSFVVEEHSGDSLSNETTSQNAEESICPLERAERILKERRRAKRQLAKAGISEHSPQLKKTKFKTKKKAVICTSDSSDDFC